MDVQTQEKLSNIETNLECLNPKWLSYSQRCELLETMQFLVDLVREQETQLAKYERVAEAARHWRETQANGTWKMQGGSKEMFDMLQVKIARRQTLIDAVDDLNA